MMTARSTSATFTAAAALVAGAGLSLTSCGTDDVEGAMPYDQEFYDQRADLVGEVVTLSAEVEDVIGDDGLTVDSTGTDSMMVLYDMDLVDVEEGQLVVVTGTVEEAFDYTVLDDQSEEDFTDDLYQDYEAQPYIEATDVTLVAED